jgi:hypothetical protein
MPMRGAAGLAFLSHVYAPEISHICGKYAPNKSISCQTGQHMHSGHMRSRRKVTSKTYSSLPWTCTQIVRDFGLPKAPAGPSASTTMMFWKVPIVILPL